MTQSLIAANWDAKTAYWTVLVVFAAAILGADGLLVVGKLARLSCAGCDPLPRHPRPQAPVAQPVCQWSCVRVGTERCLARVELST